MMSNFMKIRIRQPTKIWHSIKFSEELDSYIIADPNDEDSSRFITKRIRYLKETEEMGLGLIVGVLKREDPNYKGMSNDNLKITSKLKIGDKVPFKLFNTQAIRIHYDAINSSIDDSNDIKINKALQKYKKVIIEELNREDKRGEDTKDMEFSHKIVNINIVEKTKEDFKLNIIFESEIVDSGIDIIKNSPFIIKKEIKNDLELIQKFIENWKNNFITSVNFSKDGDTICFLSINTDHLKNGFINWQSARRFTYGDLLGFQIGLKEKINVKITYIVDTENLVKELYLIWSKKLSSINIEHFDRLIKKINENTFELEFYYDDQIYSLLTTESFRKYFQTFEPYEFYGEEGRLDNAGSYHFDNRFLIIQENITPEEEELSLKEYNNMKGILSFIKDYSSDGGIFITAFEIRFDADKYYEPFEDSDDYKGNLFSIYFFPFDIESLTCMKPSQILMEGSNCIIPINSYLTIRYLKLFQRFYDLMIQKEIKLLKKIYSDEINEVQFELNEKNERVFNSINYEEIYNRIYKKYF